MAIALSQLQQEIIDEIRRNVSNGEAIVAASAMKILTAYAGEMQNGFLFLSTDDIELMFRQRGTSDVTKARQMSTLWWIFETARFRGLVPATPLNKSLDLRSYKSNRTSKRTTPLSTPLSRTAQAPSGPPLRSFEEPDCC